MKPRVFRWKDLVCFSVVASAVDFIPALVLDLSLALNLPPAVTSYLVILLVLVLRDPLALGVAGLLVWGLRRQCRDIIARSQGFLVVAVMAGTYFVFDQVSDSLFKWVHAIGPQGLRPAILPWLGVSAVLKACMMLWAGWRANTADSLEGWTVGSFRPRAVYMPVILLTLAVGGMSLCYGTLLAGLIALADNLGLPWWTGLSQSLFQTLNVFGVGLALAVGALFKRLFGKGEGLLAIGIGGVWVSTLFYLQSVLGVVFMRPYLTGAWMAVIIITSSLLALIVGVIVRRLRRLRLGTQPVPPPQQSERDHGPERLVGGPGPRLGR